MTTEQTILKAQGVVQASSQQDLPRDDGTSYSRFILDILLDGRSKPTRFSTFDDKVVPKGVRGKKVFIEYTDKKITDREGKPLVFHNLQKLSLTAPAPEPDDGAEPSFDVDEPPEERGAARTRTPVTQTSESRRILDENRVEQGMAYGNAHHAAARLLSGYLIAYHHEPNDEEMDRLISIELEMARRIYAGRESLE